MARPWSARCYGVARQRDRSRPKRRGVSGVLLSGISGSRVGAEQSGAAKFLNSGLLVSRRVKSLDLLVSVPLFVCFVCLARARGQAVVGPCYGVARQRD